MINIKNTKATLAIKPFNTGSISPIEQDKENANLVKFLLVSAGACLIMLEPSLSMANAGGGVGDVTNATNFETMIQAVITFMTGTIAKSVAVLAVVILGFMAMAGKLAWDVAGKVILGIILIFSATQIVELFVA